ncbi:MAG: hypothetical protein WA672_16765 [Candidatus Angelobacter sp.]
MTLSAETTSLEDSRVPRARINLVTVIAVAIVSYAAADAVHELLGHGTVALLLGIKITSISSVGLQSYESSRLLSAAGSVANVLAGIISFLLLRRRQRLDSTAYFLWLFGFVNVMSGTCYLLASALLNNGDWSIVIGGLNPARLWRAGMGAVGAGLYFLFVRWAGILMTRLVAGGAPSSQELSRLTLPAYLAGGVLLTLAAVFNPFSRSLILLSGVGASLGLTWGLLFIPQLVTTGIQQEKAVFHTLSFSWTWALLAAIVAIFFILVCGPGARFG